ncbi:hypothetical protein F2Q70_00004340 [Brassica cretica]|uniref:Uncharacterized protein n=1 Tax=Brassica cretica TaxID=69181 RepID=A0A8S9J3H2_BRACR|nr:hypothetical protein F2Q70_00004340 [Brassica cretica]
MPSSTRSNKDKHLLFSQDPAHLEHSIRKDQRSTSIDSEAFMSTDSCTQPSTDTRVSSLTDLPRSTSIDTTPHTSIDPHSRSMVAIVILRQDENGNLYDQDGHLRNATCQKLDAQGNEMDGFTKRVLRIPVEKPFDEVYFTHRERMKPRITLKKKSDPGKFAIPRVVNLQELGNDLGYIVACHCGAEYKTEFSESIDTRTVSSIDSNESPTTDERYPTSLDGKQPSSWADSGFHESFAVDTVIPSSNEDPTEEYDEDYWKERATEIAMHDDRYSGLSFNNTSPQSIDSTAPATIDRHMVASIDTKSTSDDEQLIHNKMESMHEELNELSAYAYDKIGWHQFSIETLQERLQNISNAIQKMDDRWTRNDEATRSFIAAWSRIPPRKPSANPPEPATNPSDTTPEPMQVDKATEGRMLRKRKEKIPKNLKREANEKEMDGFTKRVLRIPVEKPFDEVYFTHRLWMFFRETKETEDDIRRMFHHVRERMKLRITLKKKSDPGKFVIPCVVKGIEFPQALCDTGASVNLVELVNDLGYIAACHCEAEYETEYSESIDTRTVSSINSNESPTTDECYPTSLDGKQPVDHFTLPDQCYPDFAFQQPNNRGRDDNSIGSWADSGFHESFAVDTVIPSSNEDPTEEYDEDYWKEIAIGIAMQDDRYSGHSFNNTSPQSIDSTAPATIDRHMVASIDTKSTSNDEQLIHNKMESMHEELNELSAYAYDKIGWHQFSIETLQERLQNISNAIQKMNERWTRNDEATRKYETEYSESIDTRTVSSIDSNESPTTDERYPTSLDGKQPVDRFTLPNQCYPDFAFQQPNNRGRDDYSIGSWADSGFHESFAMDTVIPSSNEDPTEEYDEDYWKERAIEIAMHDDRYSGHSFNNTSPQSIDSTATATIDRHMVASSDTKSTSDDEQLIHNKMESMHEELNELSAYAYDKIGWPQFSIETLQERLQNMSNAILKMDERWTRNDEATRILKMLKWINLSTIHTCLDCLKEPKLTSNTKPDIIACLGLGIHGIGFFRQVWKIPIKRIRTGLGGGNLQGSLHKEFLDIGQKEVSMAWWQPPLSLDSLKPVQS